MAEPSTVDPQDVSGLGDRQDARHDALRCNRRRPGRQSLRKLESGRHSVCSATSTRLAQPQGYSCGLTRGDHGHCDARGSSAPTGFSIRGGSRTPTRSTSRTSPPSIAPGRSARFKTKIDVPCGSGWAATEDDLKDKPAARVRKHQQGEPAQGKAQCRSPPPTMQPATDQQRGEHDRHA